jgi:hypothetical protein
VAVVIVVVAVVVAVVVVAVVVAVVVVVGAVRKAWPLADLGKPCPKGIYLELLCLVSSPT